MGDLTANFSLDEFLVSDTAEALGIENTPTKEHRQRIAEVTAPGMQIIRDEIGRSIIMTSAYRNPTVNKAVGGVATSAHPQGWATDSRAAALTPFAYASRIAEMMKPGGKLHGMVDQLILESSRNIVHVSFDPREGKGGPRGHIRTQKFGPGTPVINGLVR